MNPQEVLGLAAGLTGRSVAEISIGQMHTWLKTSLCPPSTRTRDGLGSYTVGGASIGVCPECLAERPFAVKAGWRLRLLPACTKHQLLLIDKCPKCGKAPRRGVDTRNISTDFFSTGCDSCQYQSLPRISVTEELIEAVTQVSNQLHLEAQGADGIPDQRLDLAAVRDLSHVLLPHLLSDDVYVQGGAQARRTTTIAKTLPMALALLNGNASPRILADTPERIRANYYCGHTGNHRPAVLALINQSRRARRGFKQSQKQQRNCIVPWPESLDVTQLPHALTDDLHDAARNLGWDPTLEEVERWSALLTAHYRLESGGGVDQERPATSVETEDLGKLLQSAEALGTDDRLRQSAEATAEALARRWNIAERKRRKFTSQRAG